MAKVGIPRHQAARVRPLLRPRPRAQPALLHRGHGLRRDRRELRGADAGRPAEVGRLPRRQLRGGVHHPARRGRARRALAAQVPRRRRHAELRGRGRGEDVPPARGPRRDADRRRAARQGRARQRDRLVLDHDALRRHHLPLRRAPRLPRALPGLRDVRQAARRKQSARLRGLRPHHLELRDARARVALARARDGLRALLGDPVPHHRTSTRPSSTARACARSSTGTRTRA